MDHTRKTQPTARQILANELKLRQARHPSYTLRAFARDLSISPSQVSRILTSRAGLSRKAAEKITQRLKFSANATQRFLNLVELEYARTDTERMIAKEKLLASEHAYSALDRAAFAAVEHWHYYGILCLTDLEEFREDPEWIAERLDIDVAHVQPALDHLFRLGLIRRKAGRVVPTPASIAHSAGLPNRVIRTFHRQLIHKALETIDGVNAPKRHLSSSLLCVDQKRFKEAQLEIQRFTDQFKKKFTSGQRNQVYCLSLQFFGITQESSKPAKPSRRPDRRKPSSR